MENNKLTVWEVRAGDVHRFVVADGMQTMRQYFYIGSGGYIRERRDMEATKEMEILDPKPPPPAKASDFTKLEKASLMIAQGYISFGHQIAIDGVKYPIHVASVMVAQAVLEEANK